jgi:hypothetical protein
MKRSRWPRALRRALPFFSQKLAQGRGVEHRLRLALDWISRLGAAVATAEFPAFAGVSAIVDLAREKGFAVALASCDGVVAGDTRLRSRAASWRC